MAERIFTPEQLSEFDGRGGRPVYLAVDGTVYDVSDSFLWMKGDHQGLHTAGKDLTEDIEEAPHEADFLHRFPVVGRME